MVEACNGGFAWFSRWEAGLEKVSSLPKRPVDEGLIRECNASAKHRVSDTISSQLTWPFKYIKSKAKMPTLTLTSCMLTSFLALLARVWKVSRALVSGSIATISASIMKDCTPVSFPSSSTCRDDRSCGMSWRISGYLAVMSC